MAKDKVTVTIDRDVLAALDAEAAEAGLNRSQYVEAALTREFHRRRLAKVTPPAAPAPEFADPATPEGLRALLDWQRDTAT
ncbi:MAG TPA: ribbon-helix-helix protein, CopG family [Micromonosporaceae bacterium]